VSGRRWWAPRLRLWVKLAALAAIGVVVTHAAHLVLTNRAATRTLVAQQATIGRTLAHVLADQITDSLLVNDLVTLHELAARATADDAAVRYLLVIRRGEVVASSFRGPPPPELVALRADGSRDPLVVAAGDARTLDLVEPVLGDLAVIRVGLDMRAIQQARRGIAIRLGLIALAVIGVGLVAALVVGRSVGAPVQEMVDAADRFDPAAAAEVPEVRPRGSREIATLAERFNRMMHRLRAAHAEGVRARQKAVETERMVALGSLVAGVAHEVNNPLAGLKNCVRRLERDDLPEEKRREYLALMEEGLVRIEEVMKRLLDFGRPHPPRLLPYSATRLAEDAITLLRPLLERRGIASRLLGGADALALADRRLVGQALVNLLLNATYVTRDGGELRVRLRRRAGLVGVAVEDDGPGIPPDVRERILDPFFSTKPEGEGTGLGLSVTRTIVDAHEGELTFEFPDAGGTIATIWLRDAVREGEAVA
jgi:two-component system, NtrC family, sensor kinase